MSSSGLDPSPALTALSARFAPRAVDTALGAVGYRQAGVGRRTAPGAAAPLVLLHGIGSGSGSWVRQLEAQGAVREVVAWDAPGYGLSAPLAAARPQAVDYGQRLWAWLDALDLMQPVTLVGHSLGALMAAAACRLQPRRVQRLVLLSPAQGYGRADAAVREAKRRDRLDTLRTLGPAGMADRRGAAMLSPQAAPELVAYVQSTMAQVIVAGYTQATHLLADADLLGLLAGVPVQGGVASGAADGITPPAGCEAVAHALGWPYMSLGPVGHACALEAPDRVGALLQDPPGPSCEAAA